MRHWGRGLTALIFALLAAAPASAEVGTENVVGTICGIIETSAHAQNVPVGFLTRLIWQESNFQTHAVSPAGAQGIAQFMPGTATARGLADPFDPEQAIPKSAALLSAIGGSRRRLRTPGRAGSRASSRATPICPARRRITSRSSAAMRRRSGAAPTPPS
jgi:soluble lytic murein transglycosylase-like protein